MKYCGWMRKLGRARFMFGLGKDRWGKFFGLNISGSLARPGAWIDDITSFGFDVCILGFSLDFSVQFDDW